MTVIVRFGRSKESTKLKINERREINVTEGLGAYSGIEVRRFTKARQIGSMRCTLWKLVTT